MVAAPRGLAMSKLLNTSSRVCKPSEAQMTLSVRSCDIGGTCAGLCRVCSCAGHYRRCSTSSLSGRGQACTQQQEHLVLQQHQAAADGLWHKI